MNVSPELILTSQRCVLRYPSLADIPAVFSATRYPGFNDGMVWDPPADAAELIPPFERMSNAWREGRAYTFSIDLADTGQFAGRITIRKQSEAGLWNIGYFTHPEVQGQGLATEAARAILEFGFTVLGASRIEAGHSLWNTASERVLQKIGMTFVRHEPQGFQKKGAWVPENILAIDREVWMRQRQRA